MQYGDGRPVRIGDSGGLHPVPARSQVNADGCSPCASSWSVVMDPVRRVDHHQPAGRDLPFQCRLPLRDRQSGIDHGQKLFFRVGAPPPDDATLFPQEGRVKRFVTEDEGTMGRPSAEFDEAVEVIDTAGKAVVAPCFDVAAAGLVRDAAPLMSGCGVEDHVRAAVGTDPVQIHVR